MRKVSDDGVVPVIVISESIIKHFKDVDVQELICSPRDRAFPYLFEQFAVMRSPLEFLGQCTIFPRGRPARNTVTTGRHPRKGQAYRPLHPIQSRAREDTMSASSGYAARHGYRLAGFNEHDGVQAHERTVRLL